MKKLIIAAAVSAASLASASVLAVEDLSYNYVDGFYNQIDLDGSVGSISSLDGFGVRGSLEVGGGFFVHTGYRNSKKSGVEMEDFTLGGGYAHYISPTALVYGSLDYRNLEASSRFSNASEDGLGLAVGVRGMVSPSLELRGGLRHDDFGGGLDETFAEVGVQYNITRQLGLIGEGMLSSGDNQYLAGLRYGF